MPALTTKIALNFSSNVLPMFVGVFVIPLLIQGMGLERFGMLSIAWMLVGYFGLLDMGLGRALTQKVAERIGALNTNNLKPLIWKSLAFVVLFGMTGTLVLVFSAHYLVYELFNISEDLKLESLYAIYWLAFTIPLVIVSTGLLGVLEGQQHFGWTASVRAPLGVMMFLAPLVILSWTNSLEWILVALFFIRLVTFVFLVMIVVKTTRTYQGSKSDLAELKSLFVFGGWITISNVISPLMVYFDRFYIAVVLSVSVVAFYTTPFDLLTKALVIPFAFIGVMFASFATDWKGNPQKVVRQFKLSVGVVLLVMLPFSGLLYWFAYAGMEIWLGHEFANQSYQIVQLLAIGILLNALAMVPFAFIQAVGRADITAKLHMVELPFYAFVLWYCVENWGLIGAAIAWTFRVFVDAVLLYGCSVYLIAKEKDIVVTC
ncbi:MAG: flippase [Thiotrichales bacterium]|jgi:O-antigen/teichoic acid export membrane protein|nr:flippase [Thiotrichales bacterium]